MGKANRGIEILVKALYQGAGMHSAITDMQRLEKQAADSAAKVDREMAKILKKSEAGQVTSEARRRLATMDAAGQKQFLSEAESSQGAAKGLSLNLSELQSSMFAVTAAITGVVAAAKGLYELGQAGAEIQQTEKGFNALTDSAGISTNLLLEMQAASRGTMSDLTLMASASTLLAGTSGDLQTALADAAPRLVEIARAADILSPTVNGADDAFERLAIGIRRNSPKRIDDLGINLKLGNAYDAYAEKVGKATDSLSEEEQQMAILNAVMEQGQALIDQSTKATSENDQAFKQFSASMQNGWNNLKKSAANSVGPVIKAMNAGTLKINEQRDGLFQAGKNAMAAGMSYEYYAAMIQEAAKAAGMMIDAEGRLVKNRVGGGGYNVISDNFLMKPEQYAQAQAQMTAPEAAPSYAAAILRADTMAAKVAREDSADPAAQARAQALAAREAQKLAQAETLVANSVNGKLGPAYAEYLATTKELNAQTATLTTEYDRLIAAGYSPASKYLSDMKAKIDELNATQLNLNASMQNSTATLTYQVAAAGLSAEAQLEMARSLGLVDEATYAVTKANLDLKAKYDANKDGVISTNENLGDYIRQVADLQSKIDQLQSKHIQITVSTINGVSGGPGPGSGQVGNYDPKDQNEPAIAAAKGLAMTVPANYPNDSYRMNLALTSGEELYVVPRGAEGQGGGTTIVNNSIRAQYVVQSRQSTPAAALRQQARRAGG